MFEQIRVIHRTCVSPSCCLDVISTTHYITVDKQTNNYNGCCRWFWVFPNLFNDSGRNWLL